jgi:hypothetical protein
MIQELALDIEASDVTGQKKIRVKRMQSDATVGELIDGLLPRLKLPRQDTGGHALTYHAHLDREGRHLNSSEIVGEVLQLDDKITLQPNIDAGGTGDRGPEG